MRDARLVLPTTQQHLFDLIEPEQIATAMRFVPACDAPAIEIVVYGTPAPQGSKNGFAIKKDGAYTGRVAMHESSKAVKPWRQDVKNAARDAINAHPGWVPLDGPLTASMVFTVAHQPVSRPSWWPSGTAWSKKMRWRPASMPDLSKLLRSTEDALTQAGVWKDDARVVSYRALDKHYVGDAAPDVLPDGTGAVIRVWRIGGLS